MRRFALPAIAALLAACQPQPANEAAMNAPAAEEPVIPAPATNEPVPPTPSKTDIDYRSDLRLVGTEPFWGVGITSAQIKLQRPDHADVTAPNTGPTINGDVAVWSARELTIRLAPADCSDGMSDNRYPYEATVTVGGEVLKGCAARADQWPRGG